MRLAPQPLEIDISPFRYLMTTAMTTLYPEDSSQLPLVWAHGRAVRRGGTPLWKRKQGQFWIPAKIPIGHEFLGQKLPENA